MSIWRNSLWTSVCTTTALCSISASALAVSVLPDSSHRDWAGVVKEVPLPDGSTLFEYSAQTASSSVDGALLALSFIPRFNCNPTLYLRLPSDYWPDNTDSVIALDIAFNNQTYRYPALIDEEPGFKTYSISTSIEEFVELQRLVDYSSRASFQPAQVSDKPTEQQDSPDAVGKAMDKVDTVRSIEYSLLGSRRSARATESLCEQHQPIPFSAQ